MPEMSSDQSSGGLDTKKSDRLSVTGWTQYPKRCAVLALLVAGNIMDIPGAS